MFKKFLIALVLVFSVGFANAQYNNNTPLSSQRGTLHGAGAPPASLCYAPNASDSLGTVGMVYVNTTNGSTDTCDAAGAWVAGPTGTVTTPPTGTGFVTVTAGVQNTTATPTVAVTQGGTGSTTAAAALAALGAAPLASPSLTGTPIAPTAAAATNTTQLATTAFAHSLVFHSIVTATATTTQTVTITGSLTTSTCTLQGNTVVGTGYLLSTKFAAAGTLTITWGTTATAGDTFNLNCVL